MKNGLSAFVASLHEIDRVCGDFLVNRFHALLGQRAGVLDGLFADLAESRVIGGIVLVRRVAVQDAARSEHRLELRVLRIIHIFRLLFRIQVIEVAEPFIEPVDRGQHVVAVAEMVLAELARHVAVRLEQVGEGRVGRGNAFLRAGQTDLGEAGTNGRLAGDECRATGGATLLTIEVREQRAFLGEAVDVRRLVAHHAHVVGAEVELADVVSPDNEDVGFLVRRPGRSEDAQRQPNGQRKTLEFHHLWSPGVGGVQYASGHAGSCQSAIWTGDCAICGTRITWNYSSNTVDCILPCRKQPLAVFCPMSAAW